MKVSFLTRSNANLNRRNEGVYIASLYVLFDVVYNLATCANFMLWYLKRDSWSDQAIVAFALMSAKNEKEKKMILDTQNDYSIFKKIRNRNRQELVAYNCLKQLYKTMKKMAEGEMAVRIEMQKATNLLPLTDQDDGALVCQGCPEHYEGKNVDELIQLLPDMLTLEADIPVLSETIDFVVPHRKSIDSPTQQNDDIKYLSYPLLEIPILSSLSPTELKNLRESFLPQMKTTGDAIVAFRKKFSAMTFEPQHFEQFDQLVADEIDAAQIQQKFDNQLLVQKAWSLIKGKNYTMLCLGISNNKNIIDLYQQLAFMPEYVGATIKKHLYRDGIAEQGNVFLYFHIPFADKNPFPPMSRHHKVD